MRGVLIALVLACLVVCGCTTKESGILVREAPFAVGRTTFRTVVGKWGNPDSVKGRVAIWKVATSNGGRVKAGYMMVGVTTSALQLATREYRLTFDGANVLRDMQTLDSIPDGAGWTILPWR